MQAGNVRLHVTSRRGILRDARPPAEGGRKRDFVSALSSGRLCELCARTSVFRCSVGRLSGLLSDLMGGKWAESVLQINQICLLNRIELQSGQMPPKQICFLAPRLKLSPHF